MAYLSRVTGAAALGLAAYLTALPAATGEVNIYSARKEELIKPLLERYSRQTGIEVNLLTGKADGLLKRLEVEGRLSPADVFLTVDAGRLHRAKEAGVLQPVRSAVLERAVPANLRDGEGYWFGLSKRARIIVYARDRVSPDELSTYEALADPMWKGRVCVRSSSNVYNQSLVASMIADIGEAKTEDWVRGLMDNLAHSPRGGDTDLLKAVAAGVCDVTLANTYYLGRMIDSDDAELRAQAAKLAVFWPNQGEGGRGAHVNVSGAGVVATSSRVDAAVRLLEFLVSEEAQTWYAEVNHEYPVVPGVEISKILRGFGGFKSDDVQLERLGELNRTALELMDRAGWR